MRLKFGSDWVGAALAAIADRNSTDFVSVEKQ